MSAGLSELDRLSEQELEQRAHARLNACFDELAQVEDDAREALRPRNIIRRHPWLLVGIGGAAAGLLVRWFTRARRSRTGEARPGARREGGFFGGLLSTALSKLIRMVLPLAINWAAARFSSRKEDAEEPRGRESPGASGPRAAVDDSE